jgi:flagellar assembly factor FliW
LQISTTRFGTIEIPEGQVIHLPSGMIGFPNHQRYVFVEHKKGSPFVWLQSVDDESLAFVLADPLLVRPDYEIQISREDRQALELNESCAGMQPMVVVNITSAHPVKITANLLGPIIFNVPKKVAKQIIVYQVGYSTQVPFPTNGKQEIERRGKPTGER